MRISDNGIGIDPERLLSIFRAFEQGEQDIQTRYGGLGLGLAICQAMVDAHKGTISAASDGKGKGATFTVTLPLANQLPAGTGGIAADVFLHAAIKFENPTSFAKSRGANSRESFK